jgi:hypothetical protein
MPWFLLNWTAASPAAGELQGYYAYPFMVAMGWPVVAVLCQYGRSASRSILRDALLLQIVLILIGLLGWDRDRRAPTLTVVYFSRWSSYLPKWMPLVDGKRSDIRPETRDLALEIAQNPVLGTVVADTGVLAFTFEPAPQLLSVTQFNRIRQQGVADTVAYFCPGGGAPSDLVAKAAAKAGLTKSYWAYPTSVCLLTNRSLEELGQLGRSLQPKPLSTGAGTPH